MHMFQLWFLFPAFDEALQAFKSSLHKFSTYLIHLYSFQPYRLMKYLENVIWEQYLVIQIFTIPFRVLKHEIHYPVEALHLFIG